MMIFRESLTGGAWLGGVCPAAGTREHAAKRITPRIPESFIATSGGRWIVYPRALAEVLSQSPGEVNPRRSSAFPSRRRRRVGARRRGLARAARLRQRL